MSDVVVKLNQLTGKKHFLFMDKCRHAAELLMFLAKKLGFNDLIIQEEGGWYTYEKSGLKVGLNVIKAPMQSGVLLKDKFPFIPALVLLNSNPGYAYIDKFTFFDEIKKTGSLFVHDIVSSIGEDYSTRGDFLIGSFGKDKPLSISSGGAFIAFDSDHHLKLLLDLKNEHFQGSGEGISFDELSLALDNVLKKKKRWVEFSSSIKKKLLSSGFDVLNNNDSINIFVKAVGSKRENLIKFCEENNLPYQVCPLYIRTLDDNVISIEIKKLDLEG